MSARADRDLEPHSLGGAPWLRAAILLSPLVMVLSAAIAMRAAGPNATGIDRFEYAAAGAAAAGAALIALSTRPAWPLSIGLALTAFNGRWDTMGIPIAIDRLMVGTAIVSVLIREARRAPGALRLRPVDCLLAVAGIYALMSAIVAGSFEITQVRFALIDRFSLLGFVLFFVAPKVYREARDRQILLGALVALGGYLGMTAFFEKVGPGALVLPSYINDPSLGTHADRARGPFLEAAANGLALYACAVAAALAAFTWRDRRWRRIAAIVVGLCALGILLTVTRAAWIVSGGATLLTLLAVRKTRPFAIPAAAVVAGGVLVAFALIPGLQGQAKERAEDDRPLWDRNNANRAAFRMLEERPLLGFGWGTFQFYSGDYYRQSPDYPLTWQRNLHNVYLSNAVELGLLGTLLWFLAITVALVGSITRRGPPELRGWKIGLLALTLSYAMSALSTPLGFPLPTLLLWTWAGIARGE